MGIAYRLMYAIGFTPWDGVMPTELKRIMEGPDALPAGRALDLGSGKGTKSVYMAAHGWDVTGVEFVPRALREAQRRAEAAGVKVDFRLGDVTRLADLGLTPGYSLLFDFGCYHGLKREQKARYAEGVTALAAPGATLLMMAFTKAMPPVPSGVSESELRERFGPAWDLAWTKTNEEAGTPAMMRAAAAWFCLKKR
jgi:cyclopropane fatty-acyl-phospholipid synthase-like methyltransferase